MSKVSKRMGPLLLNRVWNFKSMDFLTYYFLIWDTSGHGRPRRKKISYLICWIVPLRSQSRNKCQIHKTSRHTASCLENYIGNGWNCAYFGKDVSNIGENSLETGYRDSTSSIPETVYSSSQHVITVWSSWPRFFKLSQATAGPSCHGGLTQTAN